MARSPAKKPPAYQGELLAYTPPSKVTPLPPDRPKGAEISDIRDAAQEFLADWLVRRNYDEALDVISDEALPCLLVTGDHTEATRQEIRQTMKKIAEMFEHRHETLSGVIEHVLAWGPNLRELNHPYSDDFYLGEVSDAFAETFLCGNRAGKREARSAVGGPATFGTYYGTLFRFRIPTAAEGALGMLWKREEGRWKMVSYDLITQ